MNPEFWRNKRVLITGHTGFKGGWLSLWLQSMGSEVIGYSQPPPTTPSIFFQADVQRDMRSILGDICDLQHLQKVVEEIQPEIIFHLAAQSLVRSSYADPVGTYATNVLGTVNVLETVRENAAVRSVVIVTTDKCYENLEDGRAYCETDRLGGFDPYSSSKAAAELVTAAFWNSFFMSANDEAQQGIASARAGNVIGGGDWAIDRLIPDVMRAVCDGKQALIRSPQAIRPWQHVLEPLCGYLILAEKLYRQPGRYAQAWNFGPDDLDGIPVSAVLQLIGESWGPGITWRLDDGPQRHEAGRLRLDSSKSRKLLGWQPQWKLSQALEATARWYKACHNQQNLRTLTLQQIESYQSALIVAKGIQE
jgi:CDP-glucose 4,6-dehydratase